MAPLHEAMTALGAHVRSQAAPGHLPVTVEGPFDLLADEVTMPGDVSSQFLTALMLVAPYFTGGLRLVLSTELHRWGRASTRSSRCPARRASPTVRCAVRR